MRIRERYANRGRIGAGKIQVLAPVRPSVHRRDPNRRTRRRGRRAPGVGEGEGMFVRGLVRRQAHLLAQRLGGKLRVRRLRQRRHARYERNGKRRAAPPGVAAPRRRRLDRLGRSVYVHAPAVIEYVLVRILLRAPHAQHGRIARRIVGKRVVVLFYVHRRIARRRHHQRPRFQRRLNHQPGCL